MTKRKSRAVPEQKRFAMGDRFRNYRQTMHLTQLQLSKLIDLDRAQISDIERGKHMPLRGTLARFEELERKVRARFLD